MRTILYSDSVNAIERDIPPLIETRNPDIRVESARTIEALYEIFFQPFNRIDVLILAAVTRHRIRQFISMSPLFENSRLILILPDRRKATLALGLKMKTSYVTYMDNDFQDIASVVRKIYHAALN